MKSQSIELVVSQKEFVDMIFIVVSLFLIFSVFRLCLQEKFIIHLIIDTPHL